MFAYGGAGLVPMLVPTFCWYFCSANSKTEYSRIVSSSLAMNSGWTPCFGFSFNFSIQFKEWTLNHDETFFNIEFFSSFCHK